MGKVKNKDDVIQYSFRVNLNKPQHLRIHQALQEMGRASYGAISRFILEAIEQCINGQPPEAAKEESSGKEKYVTLEQMEENNARLTQSILVELLVRLWSSGMEQRSMITPELMRQMGGCKDGSTVGAEASGGEERLDDAAKEMALLYADL